MKTFEKMSFMFINKISRYKNLLLTNTNLYDTIMNMKSIYAGMAELADALDSGFITISSTFENDRKRPQRLALSQWEWGAAGT